MAEVCCWDDTFHSQACCAVWLTREEMEDRSIMLDTLRAQFAAMEASLLQYRDKFLATEQIERIVLGSGY